MKSKKFFRTLCTPPFYVRPFPNPAYGPQTVFRTSSCDTNKAQTIDPRLTVVELVCVTLKKHKLLIPV